MGTRYRRLLSAGFVAAGVVLATTAFSPAANAADDDGDYTEDSTCAVEVQVNGWETGNTTNITIYNYAEEDVDGWELTFALPYGQEITNGWNSEVSQDAESVTAVNLDYNTLIAAGASTSFGYQVAYGEDGDTESAPSEFALNGVACTML